MLWVSSHGQAESAATVGCSPCAHRALHLVVLGIFELSLVGLTPAPLQGGSSKSCNVFPDWYLKTFTISYKQASYHPSRANVWFKTHPDSPCCWEVHSEWWSPPARPTPSTISDPSLEMQCRTYSENLSRCLLQSQQCPEGLTAAPERSCL